MLGAFAGGGKYSLSCFRVVTVNGLVEEKPGFRFKEQPVQELSNGVYDPSTAFWMA